MYAIIMEQGNELPDRFSVSFAIQFMIFKSTIFGVYQ